MPHTVRTIVLILAAVPFLLTAGCSATHAVTLQGDGSGTMALHLEVSKLLHDYVAGLAEVSGAPRTTAPDVIFDLLEIRRGFESQPGITVQNVSSSDPRSLDVELSFASLSNVFEGQPGLKGANAVTFAQADGLSSLRIHIDRENYRQIAAFFPMLASPLLQSLGPQVDQKITQADYLEMIRFSIGDEAPGLARKSSITIRVRPDGDIVSQAGGVASGDEVVFQVPLLRVLLLDAPLDFSLTFRPRE